MKHCLRKLKKIYRSGEEVHVHELTNGFASVAIYTKVIYKLHKIITKMTIGFTEKYTADLFLKVYRNTVHVEMRRTQNSQTIWQMGPLHVHI